METPPLGRRLAYRLLDVRLPAQYRSWVEHDLTGSGWRWRQAWWRAVPTAAFITIGWSLFWLSRSDGSAWWAVAFFGIDVVALAGITWRWPYRLQRSRLRRHGFHVPDDDSGAALWSPGPPDDPRSEPWR